MWLESLNRVLESLLWYMHPRRYISEYVHLLKICHCLSQCQKTMCHNPPFKVDTGEHVPSF